jgi:acyl-CoA synthetase (NDP forming)
VVKVSSPEIPHKSDVGGVAICRNEPVELTRTVERVLASARQRRPEARIDGALVAERVAFRAGLGLEILGGFRHDPAFGAVVVLGIGGLDTEALLGSLRPETAGALWLAEELDADAVRRRLPPTLVGQALAGRLRSACGETVAEERVIALVLGLGALARRYAGFAPPDGLGLAELEVNPFVVTLDGRFVALDGLARLLRPRALPFPRPVAELRRLLVPKSAAVVGVSAEGMNSGRVILRNLIEGGGVPREKLWAVHPRAAEIDGCACVPTAAALPEPVDMAVVAVPAEHAAEVVGELVKTRRARSVTLIPGGFAETAGGRAMEERLRALVEEAHRSDDGGVLVNGGNCLGIISEPGRYSTFFIPPHKLPLGDGPGRNVASLSQSGAYLVTQISNLSGVIRPRYAISFGNQIDVTLSDYVEYLEDDGATSVFAVYLEGFQRGDAVRFVAAARRLRAQRRPVLLYKAGRSPEGGAAALSHTAAAVGDHEVCRELAEAAGVVECPTLDAFEDWTQAFSLLAGRPACGPRVAVLTNAGFEATAAADNLAGLRLAALGPETRERLAALLPAGVVDVHNPLDTTPLTPSDRYAACAQALVEDPGVDVVLVAGVPATPYLENLAPGAGHSEDVTRDGSVVSRLVEVFRATRKPVVFSVDAGALYDPGVRLMRQAGLPCYRRVDRAIRALATFARWHLGCQAD